MNRTIQFTIQVKQAVNESFLAAGEFHGCFFQKDQKAGGILLSHSEYVKEKS